LQVGLIVPAASNISFFYKVSSEAGYDYLRFYIDDVQQNLWSGEAGWAQASFAVTAGSRNFKWTYSEDSINSIGSDCAWLDNIVFPSGVTAQLYPPQNLVANPGNGFVNLSWQLPATGTPTGYRVYRNNQNITPTPLSGLTFTDNTVTNETTYSYTVKAVYPSGESIASNPATATPSATPLQVITIGTGIATQSYPLDRYYNYSSHECIYLASELGGAGTISKLAYEKAGGTDINTIIGVNIYLKHTTSTTLATGTCSTTGYTLVYSGSFPNSATSGWMEVTFTNPFAYNGSDNLSILVLKGNQAWISAYPLWKYSVSTTRARQNHDDYSQPTSLTATSNLPNVRLTKQSAATPPVPQVPVAPVRMVAEFEPMQGALIRYPLGIPSSLVRELAEDNKLYTIVTDAPTQSAALSYYQSNGVNISNCEFIQAASDSYWTRDYGPWYIFDGNNDIKIVDFTYNRPRPNDDVIPTRVGQYFGTMVYPLSVTHAGGNIMSDGNGIAASTNLVQTENPTLTQQQLNAQMNTYLGIEDYQLFNDPNNTYIQHIDCWAKLLDVDKVLIRSVPASHAQYNAITSVVNTYATKTSSYGTPYKIYRVYTPNDEPYTNSYIINKKILVPQMGTANDAAALAAYRAAMPGYEVIGFLAGSNSWASTDAIHCRVTGIPDSLMMHISHTPLSNPVTHQAYSLSADISHYNSIIADSVRVFWKTHWNQPWRSRLLSPQTSDNWQTLLPELQYGDSLYYYLHAVDTSGRKIDTPLCGANDPFRLSVSSNIQLDISIDIVPETGIVTIIWNPVAWANSYKIYSSSTADGDYELIDTTLQNTWSHLISNSDTQKYYRVVASTD
jgi:agmatine deiminase